MTFLNQYQTIYQYKLIHVITFFTLLLDSSHLYPEMLT